MMIATIYSVWFKLPVTNRKEGSEEKSLKTSECRLSDHSKIA